MQTSIVNKSLLEQTFNETPIGIIILKFSDKVIIEANQTILNTLKFKKEELFEKTIAETGILEKEILDLLSNQSQICEYEINIRNKFGKTFNSALSSKFLFTGNERYTVLFIRCSNDKVNTRNNKNDNMIKYNPLISVLDEGIILFNDKEQIEAVNSKAEKILGISQDKLIGATSVFRDWKVIGENGTLLPVAQHPEVITFNTGKPVIKKVIGINKPENKTLWLSINSKPIFNEGTEKPAGVIVSFRDINREKISGIESNSYNMSLQKKLDMYLTKIEELKNANKELNESEQNLLKLNADKDKMFSILSHDLRSPFEALLGFSEMISNDFNDLSKKEIIYYAKSINNSAKHLLSLLDNLLHWSRIQSNTIEHSPENLNLIEKIKAVIDLMNGNAMKKNIYLYYDGCEKVNVWADENMLQSVLQNLISNALKFTEQGGEVRISAIIRGADAEVSVADTGIGMGDKELKNLFKIEKKISSRPGTEKEKGTGLGLILCKDLIEKNSGKISVTSEEGMGTQFTFTLPLVKN